MEGLKIKFIGKSIPSVPTKEIKDQCLSTDALTHGKVYEVLSVEKGWYRIFDDDGDDRYSEDELPGYIYPPELFEIVR